MSMSKSSTKPHNNALVALINIETMSSLEIAELTGKLHKHVLRDVRNMLKDLEDSPNLDSGYKSSTYVANNVIWVKEVT